MSRSVPDLTSSVEPRLLVERGEVVRLEMALQFRTADPLAVTALFAAEGGLTVEWIFSRDLLRSGVLRGIENAQGDGDVRIWSTWSDYRPVVVLSLCSPDGDATMEIDMRPVREFLEAAEALAPLDKAKVDVDAILAQIFSVKS